VSKPRRTTTGGRGSSGRPRSGRGAERPPRRPAERPAPRRRELSFADMLLISALIVIAVFAAVVLWIVLRGMF
jgi:hypothetical protein